MNTIYKNLCQLLCVVGACGFGINGALAQDERPDTNKPADPQVRIEQLKLTCDKEYVELQLYKSEVDVLKACAELKSLVKAQLNQITAQLNRAAESQDEATLKNAVAQMSRQQQLNADEQQANEVIALLNKIETSYEKFLGINWGAGLALTQINGSPYIDSASIVDNKVVVDKSYNYNAGIMLESHFFWREKDLKTQTFGGKAMGHGPFIAIELLNKEQGDIGAFTVGYMFGFKNNIKEKNSWNLGIGFFVDTNVKVLGDGIVAGQPLPPNETEIRFKEVDRTGIMVMLSYTFF